MKPSKKPKIQDAGGFFHFDRPVYEQAQKHNMTIGEFVEYCVTLFMATTEKQKPKKRPKR